MTIIKLNRKAQFNIRYMKFNEKASGSITVFLSLIILLVMALVCTTIEKSRYDSARSKSAAVTYMSLDSCFSKYVREVFDEYGILMLWKTQDEFLDEFNLYTDKNIGFKKSGVVKPADMYAVSRINTEIKSIKGITYNDCELMYNQIYNFMNLKIGEDIIEQLLEGSKDLSQGEEVNDDSEKLEECYEALKDVENSVENIKESTDKIINAEKNPENLFDYMSASLDLINKNIDLGINEHIDEINENYTKFRELYDKWSNWKNVFDKSYSEIIKYSEVYYQNVNTAKNSIKNVREDIELNKNNYQDSVYDNLIKEIDNIEAELLSEDQDKYNVKKNKETIENINKTIGVTNEKYKAAENFINEIGYCSVTDIGDWQTKLSEIYNGIDDYSNKIKGFSTTGIGINYSGENNNEKKENKYSDSIKNLKKNGVLGYVTNGNISNKKISDKDIPSSTNNNSKGKNWKNISSSEKEIRQVLLGQYALDYFSSYTDNDAAGDLNYEIEYIINGNVNDKENLNKVVNKIIVIREGFNYIYLLSDSEKKAEAYDAAMIIVGATGLPVLVKLTQLIILGAWAYAESVVDVRDLLKGYKVETLKNKDTWNLSLEGICTLESNDQGKENRNGLSYEDYERFLMFKANSSDILFRILDLIQLDMCKKYNTEFRIDECLAEAEISCEFKVKRVFTEIGFVRKKIYSSENDFSIVINQKFGY